MLSKLPKPRFITLWSCLFLLQGLAVVQAAPVDFTMPNIEGKQHSLSEYRGKWVIVNYWATWCPPCLEEMPELMSFHDKHKDRDAIVLGINYEDIEKAELKEFLEDYFITYPILRADPTSAHTPFGLLRGLPTTYIISPDGELVTTRVGSVSGEYLESVIQSKPGSPTTAKSK